MAAPIQARNLSGNGHNAWPLVLLLCALSACSPLVEPPEGGTGGAGNPNSGGATASGATASGANGSGGGFVVDRENCGDGELDAGEQCDDGNEDSLDGCNQACQMSPDYDCPTPGQPCVSNVACGDGRQHNSEGCDDGGTENGDGCSSTCSIEAGWQCRVPGRACIPLCGDSVLTAGEKCDDGNAEGGDGCSSNCLVEPGYDCTASGLGPCTAAVCGNGLVDEGEGCDAGPDNGLFFGDGSGCSKTCTKEPICRDESGVTQACSTACGDANIDADEACDDGNALDGDGCSSTCVIEGGFECTHTDNPDTVDCPDGSGKCLILPITYRDFDASHPDFYFLGQDGVECVPNASGNKDTTNPTECWDGDSTDLCQGLSASSLGPDGKPALGTNTMCECRFTDWDSDLLPDSTAGEYDKCQSGAANPTRIETTVEIVASASSFADWYHDGPNSTTVIEPLILKEIGGERYQFSSSDGDTIVDDLAEGAGALLDSGFFPLDNSSGPGSEQLCNLWPYWPNGKVTFAGCSGDQWDPSANDGSGAMAAYDGMEHNFYFTSEVRYLFKYVGGESLEFFGDDDVFVYVNGRLTLDLGAPHERLRGNVVLSDTEAISTVYAADGKAVVSTTAMTLVRGSIYEIAIFHADRHPRESNYQLTLQGFSTTSSTCGAQCGDGVVTTGEECDDGNEGESADDGLYNDDAVYGGCTRACTYGPYCGDGVANGTEQCDQGVNNTAQRGETGCTSGCTFPSRCGDGIFDSGFGEECDDGGPSSFCTEDCKIIIK